MEIKKGNAPPVNSGIFVCIYGNPGVGKTSWAATAERPLLLDFDQRGHRAYQAEKLSRIDVTSFDDIVAAAKKYRGEFKTLIIDTVGRALDRKTQEIIRVSKETPTLKAHNPFGGLSLPGYGLLKSSFYTAMDEVKQLGMDVVFVAHGKQIKDGDITSWEPDIVGSSADEVYKMSDVIGLISPVGSGFAVRMNPSELWCGKNPLGLTTIKLREAGTDGWLTPLSEIIEKTRQKVAAVKSDPPKLDILDEIRACKTVELANELVEKVLAIEDVAERDMASAEFKKMREKNGFKYTKAKGVHLAA